MPRATTALDVLYASITSSDLEKYRDALGSKGWMGLYGPLPESLKELDPDHDLIPSFVFPGNELLVGGVRVVPLKAGTQQESPLGEIILQTAWSRCLTPRPLYASAADRSNGRVTIRFIYSPLAPPNTAMKPATLETLKLAMKQYGGNFSTCDAANPRGKPLTEVIEMLIGDDKPYEGMVIQAHPSIETLYVCVRAADALPTDTTFTEIMDAISLSVFAHWDWYGDKRVIIMPRPDYPLWGHR